MKFNITKLLEHIVEIEATDLHLSVGISPMVRVNTFLKRLDDYPPLVVDDIEYVLTQIMTQEQKDIFDVNKEVDFSVSLGNKVRFRVNVFFQKGYASVAMRVVPLQVPTLEELNLPAVLGDLCALTQGFVLVTGPTGHGKSTTIAAMLERINETRAEHVITIEDPIEYVFTNKQSLIEQREMHLDTHSWGVALKSVLRQDPNVVLIGEMRDYETIAAAVTIAETGHLVFATLHTNSAAQSIDRIIDSFPENQQKQIQLQLSQSLEAVISQRLVPSPTYGMVPAIELMTATNAVSNLIREGKTFQLNNVIRTSGSMGMQTLEKNLAQLVTDGHIDLGEALKVTNEPDELRRILKEDKDK
ncbi:MAG: type IV pilus twitching motility protein PilT [Patescibacteria group bacterium]